MARLAALPLLALLVLLPAAPRAQDKDDKPADPPAPAGVWKLSLPVVRGNESSPAPQWLVKLEQKDGKWAGSVVAGSLGWDKTTLENLTVADGLVKFQMKTPKLALPCEVKVGKDPKATKLYGTATLRRDATPVELERTALASLDAFDQLRDVFGKQPLGCEAVEMALRLLQRSQEKKAKPAEVRAWAEKAVKSAELYGPVWQRDILLLVAQVLAEQEGYEGIAVGYAKRAERLVDPKEHPLAQKKVLDVLIAALKKSGGDKEATLVQGRLAKLDFRIKMKPFAGRKAKSDRAVLVELFTGAECPPCVAADLAFDALGKSYKPTEVILLQYHLHFPGPDPLTSPDGVARGGYYGDEIRGMPTMLFNGGEVNGQGGGRDAAGDKYEEYVDTIDPLLETPAKAAITLGVTRKDNKVTIATKVESAATGKEVRLRLALIEEAVNYKGGNGVPVHHHVVRAMPGGADGTVVTDKSFKKDFTVDLDELKKTLTTYLEKHNEKQAFPNKDRPLELKKLKVVAFLQNDRGGEVLQAVQADVPE